MPLRFRSRLVCAAIVLSAASANCAVGAQQPDPSPDKLAASGIHHAPRTENGYENNDGPLARASVWKWRWNRWTHGLPPPPANGYAFPVDHPDVAWIKANRSDDTMTWIGHATALLQINGVNVITDPMFSERASPFTFAGPKRRVPPGLALDELPHIDVVLISHSHYDHLDTASVEALNAQPGGPPLFLVPLGIKDWLARKGITNAQELDWGDEISVAGLDFWFMPATHWSARSLTDRNETLWGGWVVKTPAGAAHPVSVYFAGDTGYSNDFKRIGAAFGCVDLALIPVGAYEPRWFMGPQHVDPQQAVQIFEDMHAKKAIGIHWGTFELTDEALDEPPQKLAEATHEAGLPDDAFTVLHHGQMIRLDASTDSHSTCSR
ncbi:L-ascorbate metabolism protein UlaG, beta-lactamase superfamily [Burkholderia sp. YR290]|uniref:MBL fold metallo-hydrolase n=1 Tax=Paraburkholderia hospita TaxID=169430 RepID=UPI0009A5A565|nr:MBL fold metallo-hydrolase [Paraburkholderia hospita]SKC92415.1 L-ascorbate metabolism protein UlaG, beta-lactamase superfamily [Paraburkholderia hospita]SOE90762.1 L-ascorbate metabolism protein UlaG, beta-lactamase superfamily [Burkholderia sp. YR290]